MAYLVTDIAFCDADNDSFLLDLDNSTLDDVISEFDPDLFINISDYFINEPCTTIPQGISKACQDSAEHKFGINSFYTDLLNSALLPESPTGDNVEMAKIVDSAAYFAGESGPDLNNLPDFILPISPPMSPSLSSPRSSSSKNLLDMLCGNSSPDSLIDEKSFSSYEAHTPESLPSVSSVSFDGADSVTEISYEEISDMEMPMTSIVSCLSGRNDFLKDICIAKECDTKASPTSDFDVKPFGNPILGETVKGTDTKKSKRKREPRLKIVSEKDKYLRKKGQNRHASHRYRNKKKSAQMIANEKVEELEKNNWNLTEKVADLTKEIDCLKKLMMDVLKCNFKKDSV